MELADGCMASSEANADSVSVKQAEAGSVVMRKALPPRSVLCHHFWDLRAAAGKPLTFMAAITR
eukprot:1951-Eustigmatos_ZCMA.PRE.1